MTEQEPQEPDQETPEPVQEPQVEEPPRPDQEKVATVRAFSNGWHLIECGTWEISVAPDGLIMLPRFLVPGEVADFCACARAAAEVGAKVRQQNDRKTKAVGTLPRPTVVTEGPPPPGYVRLPVTARGTTPQERAATIGRPNRGRPRARDPREPRTPRQPNPPVPGGRNGQSR